MTADAKKYSKSKSAEKRVSHVSTFVAITALILFSVFLSDDLSAFAKNGLSLSARVIIPSVFPFLLLSDIAIPILKPENSGFLKKCFERIFKISANATSTLVCGLLCGFPIGASLAVSLYKNERISKCECERLMAFSNNASPGYVISAVGIALYGNVGYGILLYATTVISAILTGIALGIRKQRSSLPDNITEKRYDFAESVKKSALICIHITAFITAFSIISGLIFKVTDNVYALSLILPFLEIGNAILFISKANLSPHLALSLSAFAISFSGLSVCAQTKALNLPSEISILKYLSIKLLQGFISVIIVNILYFAITIL